MAETVCPSRAWKGRRQKEKGRSYVLAHHPNFFILPFAFSLLPCVSQHVSPRRGGGLTNNELGREYDRFHGFTSAQTREQ